MEFTVPDPTLLKIKEKRPSQEHGLRISVHGGGCSGLSYSMDWAEAPELDDIILLFGDVILFIDKKSSLFLDEGMLSYEESLVSAGFKIINKKFKGICGCGESFSM